MSSLFHTKCRAALLLALLPLVSCGSRYKVESLRKEAVTAQLEMHRDYSTPLEIPIVAEHRDTLKVTAPDGREVLIMNAVRDEDGEMVANDVLDAAVVYARFRNVAERDGKVDLRFDVIVPGQMLDSKWQIRLHPVLTVSGEDLQLDSITISGAEYRKAQLRGYQRYQRFVDSIITDSVEFVRLRDLEIFLHRNIPELYRFKEDTTLVSEEEFESAFGVTERQALDHYTDRFKIRRNDRRVASLDRMYSRYVKVPILRDGIRLDTVVNSADGDFIYSYVQSLNVRQDMSRADIVLSGGIFQEDDRIYGIPATDPLTFYISSLSSLADDRTKYLTRIIERRAEANSICWIDFAAGSTEVDTSLSNNAGEIGRIKENLYALTASGEFELDSIIVTASCSPEGAYAYNTRLSGERSRSIASYFGEELEGVRFIARSIPENWDMLRSEVARDDSLGIVQKETFASLMEVKDPDDRESALQRQPFYRYFREKLYPRLRTVRFDFCLHRAGMIKDTVHTTEPDTLYMRGVKALKDRDYRTAVTLLRPYNDFNTAVAYCAMGYNASAMEVLGGLEPGDKVEYMMALLCSRNSDDALAVQHYLNACNLNPAFVHRGNLDPEISGLIEKYRLNETFY